VEDAAEGLHVGQGVEREEAIEHMDWGEVGEELANEQRVAIGICWQVFAEPVHLRLIKEEG